MLQIQLGDHVLINEQKKIETGKTVDDHYIARVTEIFVTVAGQRKIAVQWLYRMQDTELAEAIRNDKGHKPKRNEDVRHQAAAYICPAACPVPAACQCLH